MTSREGTAKNRFCAEMENIQKDEDFNDARAAYISGYISLWFPPNTELYLRPGSNTAASTMVGFIQAVACFPEVQAPRRSRNQPRNPLRPFPHRGPRARPAVHPHYDRRVLLWMPTTIPGTVPHSSTNDDIYNGYLIPKAPNVMTNVW
jgi:hypothetical protein